MDIRNVNDIMMTDMLIPLVNLEIINTEIFFTWIKGSGSQNFIQFLFLLLFFIIVIKRISSFNLIKENKFKFKFLDAPVSWGLYFQDAASPSFEGVVDLHNRIMFYLVVILFGVSWILLSVIINFNKNNNKLVYRHLNHGTLIELIWTVGPALVLVAIAFPSFKLLYLMDEVIDPAMTVKITGLFGQKLYILYRIINIYALGENNLNNYFLREFNTLNLRAKNRIGPHNQDVISLIIGSLLGDAYCNKRLIVGSRICFRQSNIHKDYLFWLHDFFFTRGYCSNLKPRLYIRR